MQIEEQMVIGFNYTLTNQDGEVLDASNGQPLYYLHGYGNIIPGLEAQMLGKKVGDKFVAQVAAEDAYGERDEELVKTLPLELFQGVDQVEVGMRFQGEMEGGGVQSVVVTHVDDQGVTVDANHPLAGVDLTFEVEIMAIRDANAEELAHGHVHGPDGHHHH